MGERTWRGWRLKPTNRGYRQEAQEQPAHLDGIVRRTPIGRARNLNFARLTGPMSRWRRGRTSATAIVVQNSPASKTENVNLRGSHAPRFAQKPEQEPEQKADAEGGNYRQEDLRGLNPRHVDERMHVLKLIQHART